MQIRTFAVLPVLFLYLAACTGNPQEEGSVRLQQPDPEITEMVTRISEDSLEATIETLAGFGTRHTFSETRSDTFGIGVARRWIRSKMDQYSRESGGRLLVEDHRFIHQPTPHIPDSAEIVNIVATLPGSDPADDRIFVISAHYDSRAFQMMDAESEAPGANDDASGMAALMEIARVMSHYNFSATLVFLAVAGEEQGLIGSREWSGEAAREGKRIAGMITNDIIGNHRSGKGKLSASSTVRLFAGGPGPHNRMGMETARFLQTGGGNDMPTRQFARTIKETAESYQQDMDVWLIYRADRYLRGGDHFAFLEHGYPAVRMSEPNEDFRHLHQNVRVENGVQYGDLPQFVDVSYVKKVTGVNLSAMANLARSPLPPENVGMNISQYGSGTNLRWGESPSDHVDQYEVLWRETTSPVWQYRESVGDKTHFQTDSFSKDNWIFGVRAVSEGGHVGIPVFPMPFKE